MWFSNLCTIVGSYVIGKMVIAPILIGITNEAVKALDGIIHPKNNDKKEEEK